MKPIHYSLLTIALTFASAVSWSQPGDPSFFAEIIYHPYKNGQQLVVLDNTSFFDRESLKYHAMSQPPHWLWNRPIGDEYFIRDTAGVIIKSFNTSRDLKHVEQMLIKDPPINELFHGDMVDSETGEQKTGYYRVYNYSIQDYDRNDTAITNNLKAGVMDSTGNLVVPIQFKDIQLISDHFLLRADSLWGMTDMEFNCVVPHKYIDQRYGPKLVYFKDTTWYGMAYDMVNGRSIELGDYKLSTFDDERGYLSIEKDGKCGLIDIVTDKMIVPAQFDRIVTYHHFGDWRNMLYGEIVVLKDGKYGLESIRRGRLLPCIYDRIYQPHEATTGYTKVELNGVVKEVKRR